jgi:hypothetical protein
MTETNTAVATPLPYVPPKKRWYDNPDNVAAVAILIVGLLLIAMIGAIAYDFQNKITNSKPMLFNDKVYRCTMVLE